MSRWRIIIQVFSCRCGFCLVHFGLWQLLFVPQPKGDQRLPHRKQIHNRIMPSILQALLEDRFLAPTWVQDPHDLLQREKRYIRVLSFIRKVKKKTVGSVKFLVVLENTKCVFFWFRHVYAELSIRWSVRGPWASLSWFWSIQLDRLWARSVSSTVYQVYDHLFQADVLKIKMTLWALYDSCE
jgi:hypothetical protein